MTKLKLAQTFGADEWLFEREGTYFRLTRDDVRWLMTATAVEPTVALTFDGPTSWSHRPGCPVLSAAGNPQCTCPPMGAPQSKRVEFRDEQGRRCTRWE